jgi:methylated-DNA-[protein]-cysteine S-methyltransferase
MKPMSAAGFALFPTAIGACGIAWSGRGVCAVQLPETDEAATRGRLVRHFGAIEQPVPPPVRQAADRIARLLTGAAEDLADVTLDLDGIPAFEQRVYEAARRIPPGRTATYGEIAQAIGDPGSARAVGRALGRNPFTLIVPCHRVLAASGGYGGFSAPGGVSTKLRLLAIERARPHADRDLFDEAS